MEAKRASGVPFIFPCSKGEIILLNTLNVKGCKRVYVKDRIDVQDLGFTSVLKKREM